MLEEGLTNWTQSIIMRVRSATTSQLETDGFASNFNLRITDGEIVRGRDWGSPNKHAH
jgi:hypothetical protein